MKTLALPATYWVSDNTEVYWFMNSQVSIEVLLKRLLDLWLLAWESVDQPCHLLLMLLPHLLTQTFDSGLLICLVYL